MRFRALTVFTLLAAVTGCGRMAPLQPREGQPLPVKPLMAQARPTPEELLTPPVQASPQRVDELIKRSQPRRVDRFDLPPAGGGAAPLPVGTDDDIDTTNQVGPATPE